MSFQDRGDTAQLCIGEPFIGRSEPIRKSRMERGKKLFIGRRCGFHPGNSRKGSNFATLPSGQPSCPNSKAILRK